MGMTEPAAKELGKAEGFEVASVKTYFKGNSKAIAEGETDGTAKVIYRKDTGELLGVHMFRFARFGFNSGGGKCDRPARFC